LNIEGIQKRISKLEARLANSGMSISEDIGIERESSFLTPSESGMAQSTHVRTPSQGSQAFAQLQKLRTAYIAEKALLYTQKLHWKFIHDCMSHEVEVYHSQFRVLTRGAFEVLGKESVRCTEDLLREWKLLESIVGVMHS
jgi:hypothetical protein